MLAAYLASVMFIFSSFLPGSPSIQQGRNMIEGRITNPEGRPVENVRVFLQNAGYGMVAQTYTDASGRYMFRNLRLGKYYVEVEPAGTPYERQSQRVDMNAPDVGQSGGADIYRTDFVLKLDRVAQIEAKNAVIFYQDVPAPAKEALNQAAQSLKKNELGPAEAALFRAIKLFPQYYDALEMLGSLYVRHAQYDAAVPLLAHAVEVNQRSWQAFYGLGVAQLELNKRAEGLEALRRALTLNPESINANMRLGMELAKEEKSHQEAVKLLKKVTDLADKRVPDAYIALVNLYSKQKLYKEEADALEGFLRAAPETPQREEIKRKISELRLKARSQASK